MQRVIPALRCVSRLSLTRIQPFLKTKGISIKPEVCFANYCCVTRTEMAYGMEERGRLNDLDYRLFITENGQPISPFHDIPLYSNQETLECNMVVEIPRWTNHKMEINKEEPLNPIKQDVKKGKVRFVKNCFPHHGYIWNYGALPQTWEDVDHTDEEIGTKGDNDPIDICEIGEKVHKRGSVVQVKILGVMCLVDEGETDWKIIGIDKTDPLANELNDIGDVQQKLPGLIEATKEWFTIYKIPDGKPKNVFGLNGEARNREYALGVIDQTHNQWKRLIKNEDNVKRGDISCKVQRVPEGDDQITSQKAMELVNEAAPCEAPIAPPDDVNKWYYITNSEVANVSTSSNL